MAKLGIMQVINNYNWSVEQCLNHMLDLAEQCFENGADIAFMPECYQYKSVGNDITVNLNLGNAVEKYSVNYKIRCSELAKKYSSYIVPWDMEPAGDGRFYNTSYILDRQGNEVGRFRKVHLTYGEMFGGTIKGESFPVFDLDFGKIGIMICFDNYFPESARCLALQGAELILYPLYGDTLKSQWDIKLRARTIDNSVYVAPCAIQGFNKGEGVAFSGLVDPEGQTVCKLEEEGSCIVAEIEMGKKIFTNTAVINGVREDIKEYLLKVRAPEAYKPILTELNTKKWEEIIYKDEK
ncbi:MAG: carbon-nitrogen hydrolase family protein [Clostridia bacterium]|nr:carbon-nitrogen hydrolase family protein [Clostridia bacterium]